MVRFLPLSNLSLQNGMTALDWAEESEHADVVEYLTNGIHQTEPAEAVETVEVVLEEVPEVPAEVTEEEKKDGEEEEHVHPKAEEVNIGSLSAGQNLHLKLLKFHSLTYLSHHLIETNESVDAGGPPR